MTDVKRYAASDLACTNSLIASIEQITLPAREIIGKQMQKTSELEELKAKLTKELAAARDQPKRAPGTYGGRFAQILDKLLAEDLAIANILARLDRKR